MGKGYEKEEVVETGSMDQPDLDEDHKHFISTADTTGWSLKLLDVSLKSSLNFLTSSLLHPPLFSGPANFQ